MKTFKIREVTFLGLNKNGDEITFVHDFEKDKDPFLIYIEDDEYGCIKNCIQGFLADMISDETGYLVESYLYEEIIQKKRSDRFLYSKDRLKT